MFWRRLIEMVTKDWRVTDIRVTPVTPQLDVQTRALRNDVYVSFSLGMTILDLHLNEKIYKFIFLLHNIYVYFTCSIPPDSKSIPRIITSLDK